MDPDVNYPTNFLYDSVLQDVRDFFGSMEQESEILWESREGKGSRDHCFAAYAPVAIKKALDGKK